MKVYCNVSVLRTGKTLILKVLSPSVVLQVLIVLDFMPNGDMKSYLDHLVVRSEIYHTCVLQTCHSLLSV